MRKDLTGERFGRLTVLGYSHYAHNENHWKCKCDCGGVCVHRTYYLFHSSTPSCGCYKREKVAGNNFKHGGYKTRLFRIWKNMHQRCSNKGVQYYKHYGGRGIKVCPEWTTDFNTFRDWALTHGYNDTLTIDRINVDADYCPENCRWITHREQCRNRRNKLFVSYKGENVRLIDLCEKFGITYHSAWQKLKKGVSVEQIINSKPKG